MNSAARGRAQNLIVCVVDGIHAGLVGPYGNTWIETPGWNRLAAQAWLAETALLDHVSSAENLRSLFTGTHAWCRSQGRVATPAPWWHQGVAAELETILVTDQESSAHSDWAERMTEVELVEHSPTGSTSTSDDEPSINDTQLGNFFATVSARLSQLTEPYLLIAHSRGLLGPWDAPYSWRQTFVDEEDPDAPTWTQPPVQQLPSDYDPDFLHGVRAAAGAQVMVLDQCLEALLDQLNETDQRVKLVVTSSCGWGLGEHRWIGWDRRNLHAESVHVPWLVFDPATRPLSYRSGQLLQMADGAATLRDLLIDQPTETAQRDSGQRDSAAGHAELVDLPCGFAGVGGRQPERPDSRVPLALTWSDDGCRLQTPGWCCLVPRDAAHADQSADNAAEHSAEHTTDRLLEERWKLYVKPDDRWEVNDVADRCPEVVEAFRALWSELKSPGRGCFRRVELNVPELLLDAHG